MNCAIRIMAAMRDRPPLVAVLAAGRGERFGGAKLDAECAGKRLGSWALQAIHDAGLLPGVIITGSQPALFAREATEWEIVINDRASWGQGTSVALAARLAMEREEDLLLMLADMPLIRPAHLQALCATQGLCATLHPPDAAGVPIFAPETQLAAFASLLGERGAGPILRHHAGLQLVEVEPGTLRDVDTADDLASARQALLQRE